METDWCTILRVEQHENRWRVLISRRQPEVETSNHDGEGEFGLEKCEVLADAGAGAEAEGDEGEREARGAGHAVREATRVELGRVAAPRGLVVVHGQDGDQELRPARDLVRP